MSYKEERSRQLIKAIREGELNRVNKIINLCYISWTPIWTDSCIFLCEALQTKRVEIIELLLKHDCQVNSKLGIPFDTPLHLAVTNGDIKIVEILLNRGADVNNSSSKLGKTPLHIAIEGLNTKITELLLDRKANIDDRGNYGKTALHIAVELDSLPLIELLLNRGAYVDSVYNWLDAKGYTPLCVAVCGGKAQVIKLLLSRGANIDVKVDNGESPLHIATRKGFFHIVEHFLKHGAYVDTMCSSKFNEACTSLQDLLQEFYSKGQLVGMLLKYGDYVNSKWKSRSYTPLWLAVYIGHEDIVKLLLEYGANVNYQNERGKTILHLAVEKGRARIVNHILKYSPDVNIGGNRSALNAAVHGRGEENGKIIENLLRYGFTVDLQDPNNHELLRGAVEKGLFKIVEKLLKYDVNISKYAYKLLHVATRNNQEEIAKLLISYVADVNATDRHGKTAIYYATENGNLKIIELLLTNGANVKDDPKLLITAIKKKHNNESVRAEIVKLLLSKGANVNAQLPNRATNSDYLKAVEALSECSPDDNSTISREITLENLNETTALHIATYEGHKEVVEVLLRCGAEVNCKTSMKKTPLHIAAESKHHSASIVDVLIKFGASIDSRDEWGRTALHSAARKGHIEIVKSLLKHGSDINIESKKFDTPIDCAIAGVSSSSHMLSRYRRPNNSRIYNTYNQIFLLIKQHILQMKTANLFVTQRNLLACGTNNEMEDIQNQCAKEILYMKSEKINNANISFYDILTKYLHQLEIYTQNRDIVQVFQSNEYKIKFPIYADMLESNFIKRKRRKELIEESSLFFHLFSNSIPVLPYYCTENIYRYLSDEDLRVLINACKPAMPPQTKT